MTTLFWGWTRRRDPGVILVTSGTILPWQPGPPRLPLGRLATRATSNI
jgi:hypothetical protein